MILLVDIPADSCRFEKLLSLPQTLSPQATANILAPLKTQADTWAIEWASGMDQNIHLLTHHSLHSPEFHSISLYCIRLCLYVIHYNAQSSFKHFSHKFHRFDAISCQYWRLSTIWWSWRHEHFDIFTSSSESSTKSIEYFHCDWISRFKSLQALILFCSVFYVQALKDFYTKLAGQNEGACFYSTVLKYFSFLFKS